jgi:UDP-N-acetylmuramate--alanine ligase
LAIFPFLSALKSINMPPMADQTDIPANTHFIGIGGSGMSGLARIYKSSGSVVTGSDMNASHITEQLAAEGITFTIGHHQDNLPMVTELVVYSSAIPKDNPERLKAFRSGIRQLSYPEAVGLLTRRYETVSVCGTHGKTTTGGMAAAAFIAAKSDPTVLMGSTTFELGDRNSRCGKGRHFILESCEHFRNFLHYEPKYAIVTNIELDHLDYYRDSHDYIGAFREFLSKIPREGLIVANGDDSGVLEALKGNKRRVILYGSGYDNDYRIINRALFYKGKEIFKLNLGIPGIHNAYNASAVFALCHELNMDMSAAAKALLEYRGAGRRFQIMGSIGKTLVIDDYAHHPTEIAATLHAVREKYGDGKKVTCVFQPHQYSRTRHFLEDFSEAFGRADHVIVPDIIRVRDSDEDVTLTSAQTLVERISSKHPSVTASGDLDSTIVMLKKTSSDYDIIVTMGAGDVWKVAEALTSNQK